MGVSHLPLSSDFPVEQVNPMFGLHAAITRTDVNGNSPHGTGGWFPDQRLSPMEALKGFTLDAAYAQFMEHEVSTWLVIQVQVE